MLQVVKSLSQSLALLACTDLVNCVHGAGPCDPSSLTKTLISQSALCAFHTGFVCEVPKDSERDFTGMFGGEDPLLVPPAILRPRFLAQHDVAL